MKKTSRIMVRVGQKAKCKVRVRAVLVDEELSRKQKEHFFDVTSSARYSGVHLDLATRLSYISNCPVSASPCLSAQSSSSPSLSKTKLLTRSFRRPPGPARDHPEH